MHPDTVDPEADLVPVKDAKYFILLCVCLFFNIFVYKRIKDVQERKWAGTCMGLIIAYLVMGVDLWHLVLSTIGAALIAVNTGKKWCHVIVFIYAMLYFGAYRIYMYNVQTNDWLYTIIITMMVIIKITGVAFEMHMSHDARKLYPNEEDLPIDPTFMEILHYTFSYIGILTGPYIRYRTYDDFIKLPFSRYAEPKKYILEKLKYIPISTILYCIFQHFWPLDYIFSDEMTQRSLIYKLTYAPIQFQRYRFWIYSGLAMSECICASAGLGAYPSKGKNKPGHGPTEEYKQIKEMTLDEAKEAEFDFNTISNINIYEIQTSAWLCEHTRHWNKCIQYYMGVYIYRSLPKIYMSNNLRGVITEAVCAYWHTIGIGSQVSFIFVFIYYITEKIYYDIYSNLTGWKSTLMYCIAHIVHYYVIGFFILPFLVDNMEHSWKYYSSVHCLPFFVFMAINILGTFFLQAGDTNKET